MKVSFAKDSTGAPEIIGTNNYYLFGLKHSGYNNVGGNPSYNYQYNSKELQKETGWNDYGARMYMADLGRWGVIDPLAETSRRFSPYGYALNNPVSFIDPDGRKAVPVPYKGMENHLVEGSYMWQMAGGSFNPHQKVPNGSGGTSADFGGLGYTTENVNSPEQTKAFKDLIAYLTSPQYFKGIDFSQFGKPGNPFVFMIGGADLAFGLMGKSETTLSIENTLRKNGITVSSSNHDYFGSTSNVTQEFADYVAAQYSTLKTDVILYGYSRGGVEVMKVARLLEKQNIPIKLMILVDAANGPHSDKVNRVIPGNVENLINYYQTDGGSNLLGSHGAAAIKSANAHTNIQNFDTTGSYFFPGGTRNSSSINHSNIDEAYRNEVLYNILKYKR